MLDAIARAQRSVWMTQLAFDVDCVAYPRDDIRAPHAESASTGTVLAEAIVAAVARAPVDVRILLNATLLLDTTRPLRRFFAARLRLLNRIPGTIRVRGLGRFPQLLHAKLLIVDGRKPSCLAPHSRTVIGTIRDIIPSMRDGRCVSSAAGHFMMSRCD